MSVVNLMLRPNIRNRTFDWMGDRYSSIIDADHFLGHGLIGSPWQKNIQRLNIHQEAGESILEIALPGFAKEEISVSLTYKILTVRGKKGDARENEIAAKRVSHSKEMMPQPFEIRYRLPESPDQDRVRAEFANGMLRLFLTSANGSEKIQTLINVN